MPAQQGGPRFNDIAGRWHDLADRRLAHFAELYRSGRWRHYYRSEEQFAERMLEVIKAAKVWALLADREPPKVSVPVAAAKEPPAALPARAELAARPKRDGLRPAA